MPATVQFDRELRGGTMEIEDVTVQRVLPAKLVARKVSVSQMPPKNALRFGCLIPQRSSTIHRELFLIINAISEKSDQRAPHRHDPEARLFRQQFAELFRICHRRFAGEIFADVSGRFPINRRHGTDRVIFLAEIFLAFSAIREK
jgi:hypothetical protein